MIEGIFGIVFISITALLLHGAILIVCDKQKAWEKRHRMKELYGADKRRL